MGEDMSLVISAWDKKAGVAVCEGRVGKWVDGKYVPTEENHSKITRLPNGGVLGVAGHSREGFSAYASLTDVLAEQLRPAIVQAAEAHGFRELSELIPALLADCNRAHPELFFCVSLLGTDNGTVRGGAWDSDGKASVPTETDGAWLVLGPSAEMDAAVSSAVGARLGVIGLRDADRASKAIESIIRGFAAHCPDINDHTFAEIIYASPRECMNANNITTGTLAASKVLFPDGTSVSTANRVATSKSSVSINTITVAANSTSPIPGFGFSLPAHSISDVFNIFVNQSVSITASQYTTGNLMQAIWEVDGVAPVNAMTVSFGTDGYLMSITGLSVGTHTFQLAIKNSGTSSGWITVTYSASALLQQVY